MYSLDLVSYPNMCPTIIAPNVNRIKIRGIVINATFNPNFPMIISLIKLWIKNETTITVPEKNEIIINLRSLKNKTLLENLKQRDQF